VLRLARPLTLSIAFVLALSAVSAAQDEKPKKDDAKKPPPKKTAEEATEDYRNLFKAPETTIEFWKGLQFELEVGRPDLAARHLRGLIEKKAEDADLLDIINREGISAFLRLRNVQKWSNDPKENGQAKKDVEELIRQASAVQKRLLTDPDRITRFVRNLNGTEEERDYAVKELYRIGATAVPFLVEALRQASVDDRENVLYALRRMGPDAVPAILAALDIPEPALQVELIDVVQDRTRTRQVLDPLQKKVVTQTSSDLQQLRQHAETDPAPWWTPLTQSANEGVRRKATQALAELLQVAPSKLPPAKLALTREAERYYRQKVRFLDPGHVTIWRWDGNRLVAGWPGVATVPTSQAEQYYGLRFARAALAIDPTYEPAQVVFLSLALEKGVEKSGLDAPLSKAAPEVHNLLATVNPDLIVTILDRALTEKNLPVILGALRALGDLADTRATLPTTIHGDSALIRALYYPERRIQMAAADALLRLPTSPAPPGSPRAGKPPAPPAAARTVDVLRRMAAAQPVAAARPKVMVAHLKEDVTTAASQALEKAGFQPVAVHSGRDALRRLNESADVDLLMLDDALPDPGLASLLGQVRSDINTGLLPVVVLVAPDREEHVRLMTDHYKNVHVLPTAFALDADSQRQILPVLIQEAVGQPMVETQLKAYGERALYWLARMARGESPGYDIRPAGDAVLESLRSGRPGKEGQLWAIDVAGQLPGPRPQRELVEVAIDPNRDLAVRNAAAQMLVRHIEQHGMALAANEVKALHALYAADTTDPTLRGNVALVMGSMRPGTRLTGERLQGFRPPPPTAAPGAQEKEEKAPPKKEEEEKPARKGEEEKK
jgi:CheY-like chemotaxis protein